MEQAAIGWIAWTAEKNAADSLAQSGLVEAGPAVGQLRQGLRGARGI
jgi:hypothetical protein